MTMPLAVGMLLERRGKDNERDAAARHLRGRCAANVPHRPAFAKARRISRRPARRPRRGLESLGRVRPRPPQSPANQASLRLQRTLNGRSCASFLVEVELFLSIGWSCRIGEVGRFSRNRVVLVFDPKDGWLVVAWRLIPSISGLGNG